MSVTLEDAIGDSDRAFCGTSMANYAIDAIKGTVTVRLWIEPGDSVIVIKDSGRAIAKLCEGKQSD